MCENKTLKLEPKNKYLLTVKEAAAYFSICEKKIRKIITLYPEANLAVMNGSNILIRRKNFEQYVDKITEL